MPSKYGQLPLESMHLTYLLPLNSFPFGITILAYCGHHHCGHHCNMVLLQCTVACFMLFTASLFSSLSSISLWHTSASSLLFSTQGPQIWLAQIS